MHEYMLFSQVPATRHNQVLQILAGVTAAQPVDFHEQHVVYQQIKASGINAPKKGQQAQAAKAPQLIHHKLVRDCTQEGSPGPWKLRKEEQPEPGVKDLISRVVSEQVATEADLERFRTGSEWYKPVTQFVIIGNHFVQGSVLVRVLRVYTPKGPNTKDSLTSSPPTKLDVKLLDESGACIIEGSIRAVDESSTALRDTAKKQLLDFAKSVDGAIDFYPPDRLALDTRVRGV